MDLAFLIFICIAGFAILWLVVLLTYVIIWR